VFLSLSLDWNEMIVLYEEYYQQCIVGFLVTGFLVWNGGWVP